METLILNRIRNSTFLITGGAGFIGSNLAEYLVFNNAKKVIVIDNLINGKMENINHLIQKTNFYFINGDIRNFDILLTYTKDIDFVFHQAAWGSVPRSIKEPIDYTSNNIQGTHNVLEASRVNNVKKVIYASSSSVYGNHSKLPKIEGFEGKLLSPYALSKRVNEEFGNFYWEVYKLPTVGLRYFNVFGRRQNPNGDYAAVIPKFVNSFINKSKVTIYGNGEQSRDFNYIDNVIQANIKSCFYTNDNSYGKAFNVAFGQKITINQLLKSIETLFNFKIPVTYKEVRTGDINSSLADISMAKKHFKYNPNINFYQGLKLYFEWVINLNVNGF